MSIAAYKDCVNLEPGQAQGTAPTILNEEMVMDEHIVYGRGSALCLPWLSAPTILNEEMVMDEHIVYGRGSALCLPWLSGILLADANML